MAYIDIYCDTSLPTDAVAILAGSGYLWTGYTPTWGSNYVTFPLHPQDTLRVYSGVDEFNKVNWIKQTYKDWFELMPGLTLQSLTPERTDKLETLLSIRDTDIFIDLPNVPGHLYYDGYGHAIDNGVQAEGISFFIDIYPHYNELSDSYMLYVMKREIYYNIPLNRYVHNFISVGSPVSDLTPGDVRELRIENTTVTTEVTNNWDYSGIVTELQNMISGNNDNTTEITNRLEHDFSGTLKNLTLVTSESGGGSGGDLTEIVNELKDVNINLDGIEQQTSHLSTIHDDLTSIDDKLHYIDPNDQIDRNVTQEIHEKEVNFDSQGLIDKMEECFSHDFGEGRENVVQSIQFLNDCLGYFYEGFAKLYTPITDVFLKLKDDIKKWTGGN